MQPEVKWIMNYLDARPMLPDMDKCIDSLITWSRKDHGYKSKNKRIKEWGAKELTFYDILCRIFAGAILNHNGMTYQAMIGYIAGGITCAHPLDRAKCAAEVIAIAHQCELIVITKVSDITFMVTTEYVLDEDISTFVKHAPEFKKPEPTVFGQILGNRFKQHKGDVCNDHINTMNSIPLCLEQRIIDTLEETSKSTPETEEQIVAWKDHKRRSSEMYSEVAKHDKFYLKHSFDTRGRCYCEGYLVNYQGSSYKKALVSLFNKEIVKL